MARHANFRLIRNETNGGVIVSINLGSKSARSQFLYLAAARASTLTQ